MKTMNMYRDKMYTTQEFVDILGINRTLLNQWRQLFLSTRFPMAPRGKALYYSYEDMCFVFLFGTLVDSGVSRRVATQIVLDSDINFLKTKRKVFKISKFMTLNVFFTDIRVEIDRRSRIYAVENTSTAIKFARIKE